MNDTEASSSDGLSVEAVLDRVRTHEFHPVDETIQFHCIRQQGDRGADCGLIPG